MRATHPTPSKSRRDAGSLPTKEALQTPEHPLLASPEYRGGQRLPDRSVHSYAETEIGVRG
jgi:hypothetical protein